MSEGYSDAPVADTKDDEDTDYMADAREAFRIAEEAWEDNRRDNLDDVRFARDEDQWPENILYDRERDGRPCLTLNQLRTLILQVVNDARQNKPGLIVRPVGDGADQKTADIINAIIRQVQRSSNGEVAADTAIDHSVSGGFGFFRVNTVYATDDNFDQDIVLERIEDCLSVYPDPYDNGATSENWMQCWVICPISKDEWKKRWPDKDLISFEGDSRLLPEDTGEDVMQYAERWTREEVLRTIVALTPVNQEGDPGQVEQANELVGPHLVVGLDVYEEHKDLFDALGVQIQAKRDVKSYKVTQTLLSGAEVLEKIDWKGKYIPIVPVYGEEIFVEGKRRLRSLIRGAKDAQRMVNYWETTATELVALAPKAPWIGKTGTFATDAAKWATANTETHAYIEYDGQEAPERVTFAGVPAGALGQATRAQELIKSIVGIYNSSIGAPSNETSGVAINARDKQADTGSFHFIDNLNRALAHAAKIILDLVPRAYPTPRLLQVMDPDGSHRAVAVNQPTPVLGPDGQPVQQPNPLTGELEALTHVIDLTVGKYDISVKPGPSYATQREQLTTMLTDLGRSAPQTIPLIIDLIVKNMDIPDAEEVVERLKALGSQNPELQQAHQVIQQGTQKIMAMQATIDKLKGESSGYDRENEIRAYDAETKRLGVVVGSQGAGADPNQMAQVVMASLMQILRSPDILDGMANGGDPQQLAATLAQRMQPPKDDGSGGAPPAAAPLSPPMPPIAA